MIEKKIKNSIRIYKKKPLTDNNKSIINTSNKIISAIKIFKSILDNDELRIPGEYYAKPYNNINLDRINYPHGYKEIAREAGSKYVKNKNDNELKLIKDFITKINNGTINNKNKAGNKIRKLKQKVTNDILRQDPIKYLEIYLFGKDIEPEEKYEERITERITTRRQKNETDRDTQRTFAPSSPPKEDYSAETNEYLKYMEEQEKDLKNLVMNMIVMHGLVDLV